MGNPQKQSPFRQKSLARLSSPEKLDELMQVISPKGWWWVNSLGFVIGAIVLWGIFGRIPITVTGQGVLVFPRKVAQMESIAAGRLIEIKIRIGDTIKKGQVIAIVEQPELRQQLREQQDELAQLEDQFKRENSLQNQQNNSQNETLDQKRKNYEDQLKQAIIFGEILKNKNLAAIQQQKQAYLNQIQELQTTGFITLERSREALQAQRISYEQQLEKSELLEANLRETLKRQQELAKQELITQSLLLQTEQQLLQIFDQISTIRSNLKQLDYQEAQVKQNELDNNNKIINLTAQVKQLEVQEAQTEQQYVENNQKINDIKAELIQLNSQKQGINYTTKQTIDEQQQQILKLKNSIEELQLKLNEQTEIKSEFDGTVLDIQAQIGQLVNQGQSLGGILRADLDEKLMSVSYFTIGDGKQINPEMLAEITPSSVRKQDYGGIIGKVLYVSSFPVNLNDAIAAVGNQELAQSLISGNRTIAVVAEMEVDPNTVSGYRWSSRKGPDLNITQGTTTTTEVTVEQRAPITFVIPLLKSITGLE